ELAFADRELLAVLPPGVAAIAFDAIAIADPPEVRFPTVTPAPREVAMILYTSGSTGRPKGVLLGHAGQLWSVRARLNGFAEPEMERFLAAAPLYHMNALSVAKTALMGGGSLVLPAGFTPQSYIHAAARFRCTAL